MSAGVVGAAGMVLDRGRATVRTRAAEVKEFVSPRPTVDS
jgi:hypothetical protein